MFMPKVECSVVSMAEIVVFPYSPVVSIRHSLPELHPTCRCCSGREGIAGVVVEVSMERVVRQPSQPWPWWMSRGPGRVGMCITG